MKVLLVHPKADRATIGLQHVMLVEPLELEVLGALTQAPFEPVILDMQLEQRSLRWHLREQSRTSRSVSREGPDHDLGRWLLLRAAGLLGV